MEKPVISKFDMIAPLIVQKYERYLPTAFDESMTLLEKVNKVIEYLNQTGIVIDNLFEQWNQVMEWVMNDGLNEAVRLKIEKMIEDGVFHDIINQDLLGNVRGRLTDISINVMDFGAKGDGVTDDLLAIRSAIEATPTGGRLFFPPTQDGYFVSYERERYLFMLDKAIQIIGYGKTSQILIDENVPNDTDVFLIKPKSTSENNTRGYVIEGITVVSKNQSVRPARHAIHIDLTGLPTGHVVANSRFEHNFLHPLGGYSFKLTNPVNSDGFFTSQIQKNMMWAGLHLERAGDSLTITENTFAGFNKVYLDFVVGSNTCVFAFNNLTSRNGFTLKSGHNIKVMFNNFEAGYSDSSYENNAIVDLDGANVPQSYGLQAIQFIGNNITFRPQSGVGVTALRIGKSRGTLVEGNYLSNSSSLNMHITNLAQLTMIDYNTYSYIYTEGNIQNDSLTTVFKNNPITNKRNGALERYEAQSEILRYKSKTEDHILRELRLFPELKNDAVKLNFLWNVANTFSTKGIIQTQKEEADGVLGVVKQVALVKEDNLVFLNGVETRDANGFTWKITVGTDGTLTTTRLT